MRKWWLIAIVIIILFMVGVVAGFYVYQKNNTQDSNMQDYKQLAVEEQIHNEELENLITTSSSEKTISPNCMLIQKQYFKGCDHIIRNVEDIDEKYINCSQQEFEKDYKDWKIEEFTNNQITMYQEKEGFCNRHYIIKEHDGVLAIYTIDETGKENWKEDTEIQTIYLPEEDLVKIRQGIEAIGDTELHSTLEDFE